MGVLNTLGFYNHLLSFLDHAVEEGFISRENRGIVVTASTVEELLGKLALEEFKGFKDEMAAERKAREEQEEALLETLRDVIQRVRGALTGERRHGEDGGDFRELGGCHSNKLNHVNNEM